MVEGGKTEKTNSKNRKTEKTNSESNQQKR